MKKSKSEKKKKSIFYSLFVIAGTHANIPNIPSLKKRAVQLPMSLSLSLTRTSEKTAGSESIQAQATNLCSFATAVVVQICCHCSGITSVLRTKCNLKKRREKKRARARKEITRRREWRRSSCTCTGTDCAVPCACASNKKRLDYPPTIDSDVVINGCAKKRRPAAANGRSIYLPHARSQTSCFPAVRAHQAPGQSRCLGMELLFSAV